MRLVSSSASQSRFQAHFFHHLFIYSPRHCCHQSTPEGTRHTTSEEANQAKVLQQKTNSNPLPSASSILIFIIFFYMEQPTMYFSSDPDQPLKDPRLHYIQPLGRTQTTVQLQGTH